MPRLYWEGNQDWDARMERGFAGPPLPPGASPLRRPEDPVSASAPWMLLPCAVCMLAVFAKSRSAEEFLFLPWLAPAAFLLGFFTALPLHELLHAACYPRGAAVYAGVCLKRLRAYAVSYCPLTRGRFVVMSLAPALPGALALAVFLACPPTWKALMTLSIVPAFFGLLSPAPDYMDIALVLRQTPKGAAIQAADEGLFWYL